MTGNYRDRRNGQIFTGLVFLGIGILFLLGNLNIGFVRPALSQLWPVLLILIGVKQMLMWRGQAAWLGGGFWIGTGTLFLLATLGYIKVAVVNLIWPVMLIWFGVILFNGACGTGCTPRGDRS